MNLYWMLIVAGLIVSIVSALESRVQWIASFCAVFGEGCRRTEDFTLLKIPVSWWGIGYYAGLAPLLVFVEPLSFWYVMAGLGFELTFLWIMISIRAFCIFCLLNAGVVAALVWYFFDPNRIWQSATTALSFFLISNYLISRENLAKIQQTPEEQSRDGVAQIDIDKRPVMGPPDAEVVIVEFSDPFCPACRKAHEMTNRIKEVYKDRVRWVFKDFPLQRHEGAKKAAEAAHCAEEQGKFWEYQDMLFKGGEEARLDSLKGYAASLGLNQEKFAQCLDSGKFSSQIEEDIQAGKTAGISATPTFFINGKMISGAISFEEFSQKIDDELGTADGPAEPQ